MFAFDRKPRSLSARSPDTASASRRPASALWGNPGRFLRNSSSDTGVAAPLGMTEQELRPFEPPVASRPVLFDFARLPLTPPVQCKPTVSTPGDPYEREADAVADQVMRTISRESADQAPVMLQRQCASCASEEEARKRGPDIQRDAAVSGASGEANSLPGVPVADLGSSFGRPLDAHVQREMSRHIGHDFSNVRIYTDEPAAHASRNLNARAFTAGSNIFFNEGQYQPHTAQGKRLLAHELTHVVQQSRWNRGGEPRDLLQRTSVGEVLDSFFSPFSSERLWVMGPTDPYTEIVRNWQPVKDAMAQARSSIETKCSTWASIHTTSGGFEPTMGDPPVWEPRAYVRRVQSPPGTDPDTCRNHFIPYAASKNVKAVSPPSLLDLLPPIETETLHTCAIGSFSIGITVDSIDCTAKTAIMSVWMFNAMDTGSFGRFASHPAFRLSGMQRQCMWWHWTEPHAW